MKLIRTAILFPLAQALPSLNLNGEQVRWIEGFKSPITGSGSGGPGSQQGAGKPGTAGVPGYLQEVLNALEVMQDSYFDIFTGTWPAAIDWTSAVVGTQVSTTLSTIASSLESPAAGSCSTELAWQNIIDRYFAQTSVFYFGENAFGLRNQAYDDMLWVVLGWLENIKFVEMYSWKHWNVQHDSYARPGEGWHGLQFSPMAAHRARIFYDLASNGWDESLCGGGMNWNPHLLPYKNAITNELFTAASIAMYLYFPGDNNTSPYMTTTTIGGNKGFEKPHDPAHLENAIKAYKWLKESHMRSEKTGLFQDGFHVLGWHRFPNGTVNPGTGNCDELNTMVYTYNQGVVLSASRGLWIATGARSYLDDGHTLVDNVIRATGWPNHDRVWHGLGRGGIMEEFCDHSGQCSQDGQTFKGIFFLHLSEFCRPLWPQEEDFISTSSSAGFDRDVYLYHLARCAAYGRWIAHNANAALATKDHDGHFGMWWTTLDSSDHQEMIDIWNNTVLPKHAIDHLNPVPKLGQKSSEDFRDINDRGRGRTVETQSGGLAVLRARWNWQLHFQLDR